MNSNNRTLKIQGLVLSAMLLVVVSLASLTSASADCSGYVYIIPKNKFMNVGNNTSVVVGAENCYMVKSNTANVVKGEQMNMNAEKMMDLYVEKQQKENHALHERYLTMPSLNESMTAQIQKQTIAQNMYYHALSDKTSYYYEQLDKEKEIFSMMKILKQQRLNISDVNQTQ